MNCFLPIYEFRIGGLIPAYHSEIVIGNHTLGFSDEGIEVHEGPNMDGHYGYRLVTSIPLGETQKNQREIREIVRRLETEWTADSYDIFKRNCRHFSLALINELDCESTTEARRILANLIFFSEKIGSMISILMTGLIHLMPINPLVFVSRPLEVFNQGQILDLELDFKFQLLQMLVLLNSAWVILLLVSAWFSRSDDDETEILEQLENMEL